jgi:hypothetical protein
MVMGVVRIAEDGCLHPPLCTKVYYGTIHNYLHILCMYILRNINKESIYFAQPSRKHHDGEDGHVLLGQPSGCMHQHSSSE